MLILPMMTIELIADKPTLTYWIRVAVGSVVAILLMATIVSYLILQTKIAALQIEPESSFTFDDSFDFSNTPFPIGVNPITKEILNSSEHNDYVQNFAASYLARQNTNRWFDRMVSQLSTQSWFQTIATPHSRILVILPGQRKEQIADNIGSILGWNNQEKEIFVSEVTSRTPAFPEGTFFPGRYIVAANAQPEFVASLVHDRFQRSISNRYPTKHEESLPLLDVLTIASLLERESYEFSEMRIIAGIIWNRIFIDMNLQIDATLQYARANKNNDQNWWPVPRPVDKFIDSPFNTYQQPGLPPAPIANPGVPSILATLNPESTECLFYFHDARGGFHCSKTYQRHVELIRYYYGPGG